MKPQQQKKKPQQQQQQQQKQKQQQQQPHSEGGVTEGVEYDSDTTTTTTTTQDSDVSTSNKLNTRRKSAKRRTKYSGKTNESQDSVVRREGSEKISVMAAAVTTSEDECAEQKGRSVVETNAEKVGGLKSNEEDEKEELREDLPVKTRRSLRKKTSKSIKYEEVCASSKENVENLLPRSSEGDASKGTRSRGFEIADIAMEGKGHSEAGDTEEEDDKNNTVIDTTATTTNNNKSQRTTNNNKSQQQQQQQHLASPEQHIIFSNENSDMANKSLHSEIVLQPDTEDYRNISVMMDHSMNKRGMSYSEEMIPPTPQSTKMNITNMKRLINNNTNNNNNNNNTINVNSNDNNDDDANPPQCTDNVECGTPKRTILTGVSTSKALAYRNERTIDDKSNDKKAITSVIGSSKGREAVSSHDPLKEDTPMIEEEFTCSDRAFSEDIARYESECNKETASKQKQQQQNQQQTLVSNTTDLNCSHLTSSDQILCNEEYFDETETMSLNTARKVKQVHTKQKDVDTIAVLDVEDLEDDDIEVYTDRPRKEVSDGAACGDVYDCLMDDGLSVSVLGVLDNPQQKRSQYKQSQQKQSQYKQSQQKQSQYKQSQQIQSQQKLSQQKQSQQKLSQQKQSQQKQSQQKRSQQNPPLQQKKLQPEMSQPRTRTIYPKMDIDVDGDIGDIDVDDDMGDGDVDDDIKNGDVDAVGMGDDTLVEGCEDVVEEVMFIEERKENGKLNDNKSDTKEDRTAHRKDESTRVSQTDNRSIKKIPVTEKATNKEISASLQKEFMSSKQPSVLLVDSSTPENSDNAARQGRKEDAGNVINLSKELLGALDNLFSRAIILHLSALGGSLWI